MWVDDDAIGADSDYLAARRSGGAAVYRVDPAVGLLPEDIEAIRMLTDPGLYSGRSPLDLRRWAKGCDGLFLPGPRAVRTGRPGWSGCRVRRRRRMG